MSLEDIQVLEFRLFKKYGESMFKLDAETITRFIYLNNIEAEYYVPPKSKK